MENEIKEDEYEEKKCINVNYYIVAPSINNNSNDIEFAEEEQYPSY